jgi:hypothetical protein
LDNKRMQWILNHIDCFDSQARLNESITAIRLYPHALYGQDDDVWVKVGVAIGNLQALKSLCFDSCNYYHAEDEDLPTPDWKILGRILSQVRQKIDVEIANVLAWDEEESSLSLYSALATLPALQSVQLSAPPEDEITLANHESLAELLRVPSLRSVCFSDFYFTCDLCQAIANALVSTVVTNLEFRGCYFIPGECAAMANGLGRNTSVISINVVSPFDEVLCDALAKALPVNSTLRELSFVADRGWGEDGSEQHLDWSSIFSALGQNTGLKKLIVGVSCSMGQWMCAAMQNGLVMNDTLESLELNRVHLSDDNSDLLCSALSFLRTNKALKSLTIDVQTRGSCLSAFCRGIAVILHENTLLESLTIRKKWNTPKIKFEDYFVLVTALQLNTTLKSLHLGALMIRTLTHDEDKQMTMLLKKNYALERLPDIGLAGRDVADFLRLNAAGRRYLIEDGSSISKGVEVLSVVRHSINCVYLHLLENPRLCDRRAVEMAIDGESNSSPPPPLAPPPILPNGDLNDGSTGAPPGCWTCMLDGIDEVVTS